MPVRVLVLRVCVQGTVELLNSCIVAGSLLQRETLHTSYKLVHIRTNKTLPRLAWPQLCSNQRCSFGHPHVCLFLDLCGEG